jgi:hypothetical protein
MRTPEKAIHLGVFLVETWKEEMRMPANCSTQAIEPQDQAKIWNFCLLVLQKMID